MKRIFGPNSAHTRAGGQKFRKNSKKKKIEKNYSALFLAKSDETGQEREKRILDPNSAHARHGGENSEKK